MTKKSIREYEGIYPSQDLSIDDFNSLKDLIRENSSVEYPRVMTVCSDLKNGLLGLQAVNYVGTIGFSDGNSLEILPKIASVEGDDTLYSADRAKSIFLEMLMDTRYKPKEYQKTGLGHATTDVLEFFIQRYIENIRAIIRNGVAFSYYDIEVNDRYLRGSLDFPNHIKLNLVHKERFYIRTQLFGPNRPENRIIKSTLMHLYKITGDSINKRDLNDLLNCFEDIPFSTNIDADARKISIDRNMNTYQGVLDWSLLFIKNKSFDLFCGKNISYALIFPMELLYQEYIRSKIISLSRGRYTVQKKKKYEFLKEFDIDPDIVVKIGDNCFVLDTKWKKLGVDGKPGQDDLYQMYVYSARMNSKKTVLIYPMCYSYNVSKTYEEDIFGRKIIISTWFVNFDNIDNSLEEMISDFDNY